MAADVTPEDIRQAQFRTVRRGFDVAEVSRFLSEIADKMQGMIEDRQRLAARLGDYANRDLQSEFESLGREVTAVLQAAREAADAMRERASLDASRWRSEAMAEVEALRKEARNDAEALRGDAWTTGTELLNQAIAEARRIRAEAERDVLTIVGEAERDAHRLTSGARREAEDLVRAAMMDAEKMASEAKKRHDEIIEQAYRQAESAQERTRALEERREELMLELETVRTALAQLEGALEERRESLDLSSESTSVRVVPSPRIDPNEESWALGETVRVIPPADRQPTRPLPPEPAEEEVLEQPADLPTQPRIPAPRVEEPVEVAPEPEPEVELEPVEEPEPARPEPGQPAVSEEPSEPPVDTSAEQPEDEPEDDVAELFAALRGAPKPTITVRAAEPEPAPEKPVRPQPMASAEPPSPTVDSDVIEARDARLLPITNRALRGVKKAVTDAQNFALDGLRTDEGWHPEAPVLAEMMRADLIGLWAESYSAGHAAAEEMTGARLKRGVTPPSDAADDFAADLAGAVSSALVNAGEGQREKQAATSRVFRGWRTDEAERRVRELALVGYHRGLVDSVGESDGLRWVASGTPCSACRAAAAEPGSRIPPVHHGCECTVAVEPV